jgi:unsaturated rhamnogalacturonyl hydrolase
MRSLLAQESIESAGSFRLYSLSMIRFGCLLVFCLCCNGVALTQTKSSSERVADSIVANPGFPADSWSEGMGLELEGLDAAWYNTANGDYFRRAKSSVDSVLNSATQSAAIQGSSPAAKNLFGRQLLLLYRVTLNLKYYKAAAELHAQLAAGCGVPSPEPSASASNAPCVAQPFLAEYASVFQQPQDFPNITKSFENAEGQPAPQVAVSLVDALPYYPQQDPGRATLIALLRRVAAKIAAPQAAPSPSSVDSLSVYALAKGVRLGYLPVSDLTRAKQAWGKISAKFDSSSTTASGDHDAAELGAFLLAATEIDQASTAAVARGETVVLDAWYNSQQRKNAAGQMESFHYKWSDMSDSGYALLGHMFRGYGAATETLDAAPTQENLRSAEFYLIASPDIPVKNPNPHYMTEKDASEIAAWVKQGGVLILLENDPPNADIAHLNLLADHFGIHFDDVLHHHIIGEQVEDGRIPVAPDGKLFHQAHTLYMKDTCAISLHAPTAVALLSDRGDVVMATAKYGRGTVFAAVDPWLYNEYTDGRKNPQIYNQFDNFAGGKELVQWLLQQHSRPATSARKKELQ